MAPEEPMEKLLKEQMALGQTISGTNQLLRFALSLSAQNLLAIREQLLAIQDLAESVAEDAAAKDIPLPQGGDEPPAGCTAAGEDRPA